MARKFSAPEEYTGQEGEELEEQAYEERKPFPVRLLIIGLGVGAVLLLGLFLYSKAVNKGNNMDPSPANTDIIMPGDGEMSGGLDIDSMFEEVNAFTYTADEIQALRSWGYTASEIENSEANSVPAADLITASKEAQEKAREELNNPESEAYKELMSKTWLGQDLQNLPEYYSTMDLDLFYTTQTLNADYEKVEARGTGLYLKVYLPSGDYHFMECPLTRYLQLPDSGNIVVTYQVISINDYSVISNMKEKDVGDRG